MNSGAKVASGEILLFLHADTYLADNAPELIIKTLQDQNAVAGAFDLGIRSHKKVFRLIEKMVYIRSRLIEYLMETRESLLKENFLKTLAGTTTCLSWKMLTLCGVLKKPAEKLSILTKKYSLHLGDGKKKESFFALSETGH
jgi:cellulose synthase/poly-beta-1,6-N-acetylglucosamine synthase-like glycosyltransferase